MLFSLILLMLIGSPAAVTANAAANGPFDYSGFDLTEPLPQQKARLRSQNNKKKEVYEGCKYSSDWGKQPVVVESDFHGGCQVPQQFCLAALDCGDKKILDLLGNPIVMHVRCLAKNGFCPKDPGDCGMAGNTTVRKSGVVAISQEEDYFNIPWHNSKDAEARLNNLLNSEAK
jgi:hypothetical protein